MDNSVSGGRNMSLVSITITRDNPNEMSSPSAIRNETLVGTLSEIGAYLLRSKISDERLL